MFMAKQCGYPGMASLNNTINQHGVFNPHMLVMGDHPIDTVTPCTYTKTLIAIHGIPDRASL